MATKPGNLPVELTTFVGRRRELAEIKRLLTSTRMLTLTGSGGAGKTRLALRAAEEMARNFKDGAWVVALAPIDDPLLITQAVFSALDLQDVSSRWSVTALSAYLRDRRLLLVLDNCEHLLDGAAVLAGTLLKSAPELRILATSRHALGIGGEVRLRVPPLSLPSETDSMTPGQIAGYDAVALLLERAAAVQPGFVLDEANAHAVLELCARLDGLPLALELAAVRLEGLTVAQLVASLERELAAPDSAIRGGEARQRTLEATLDWSHSLLSEGQRRAWARLSVFAGGFNQPAAAAVSFDDDDREDSTSILASLVESSILQLDRGSEPPRYSMLETVRQYGRRKLREMDEDILRQTRHRDWILDLALRANSLGPEEAAGFIRVDQERDNLWTALEFCRRQPGETDAGIQIVAALTNYWLSRGPLRDIRRYLESALSMTEPQSVIRARCLIGVALFADAMDDGEAAQVAGREAMAIARAIGDVNLTGWAAGSLLFAAFVLEEKKEMDRLSTTMLEAGRSVGNQGLVGVGMHYKAQNLLWLGKVDEAIALAEEGSTILRRSGNLFVRGALLNTLADAKRRRGELAEAETVAREGVRCKRDLDDRRGLANLFETLSWIAADGRDHTRAATLLGCAASLRESMGIRILAPWLPQHNACEDVTRQRLGEAGFARAFGHGMEMSPADSVDLALGLTPLKAAPVAAAKPASVLSKRELEIARLIAEGMSNREVATKLFISSRTVETHVTNMLNKLGLNSRAQLARWVE